MTTVAEGQATPSVGTPPLAATGRPRRRPRLDRLAVTVALVACSAAFLLPFLWLVSASLRPTANVFDRTLLPVPFSPGNYVDVWREAAVLTWLFNSLVVGVAAAVSVTLSSSFVAFGFAYFRFPGRNLLFASVLATMMLPYAATMVPTYLIWDRLGLASTQIPLWATNLFGSPFYIFLLRQFFLGLPRELFEAARVDGAGPLSLFWRIAVPLIKPALIVTLIFEFQASWADLLKPLIYLRDNALFTLPRGLKVILDQFGQGGAIPRWELVLAASVISTIPMLVLFFAAQRSFVQGIATTGQKG